MAATKGNRSAESAERREVLPLEPPNTPRVITILVWTVCAYLLILPIADLLIRLDWPAGAEISWVRGRFIAVNALTLTGFQGNMPLARYPDLALGIIFILTMIGSLFPMIIGGMAVVRILRMPYSDKEIATSAVVLFGVLVAGGSIPLLAKGHELGDAFMLSASAFGNSGLFFGGVPSALSWQTHFVILPLAILGSLGLPVLMELVGLVRMKGRPSRYSITMLGATAITYLILLGSLLVIQLVEGEHLKVKGVKVLASSSVLAVDSRTVGLPIRYAEPLDLPRSGQWLLILAMMVGGCAAGTAGGIKLNTLVGVGRGIAQALRGGSVGRPIALAMIWIGVYLALTVLFFLMLLWAEPEREGDRLLFLAVSALSNVGLSHDPVTMTGAGLDVLSAAMFLGRVVPLGMLWWMAATTREAEMPVG
jgi:Trk-type K+ transport system membrane component